MRQYQAIWERIKKHGKATLIAPVDSHRRIIKAVQKEKYMDIGFKLLQSEKGVKMRLVTGSNPNSGIITFSVYDSKGRKEIKVSDL